ncbi:MAG TPA: hypothetical protein VLE73_06820 [Candidatus Saccharimonadales bacterium]|nr:hypothetical protein [Candidatus Saccharimonadales bacterium]
MAKPHHEIAGIPLKAMDGPIWQGLQAFTHRSDGIVDFVLGASNFLQLTPDESYSAHGNAHVLYWGQEVGSLSIVAFAPGDGTGKPGSLGQDPTLRHGNYPYDSGVVPQDKSHLHTEVSFALASFAIGKPDRPHINAGNLDVIHTLSYGPYGHLSKLGEIGQHRADFQRTMYDNSREGEPQPRFTLNGADAHLSGRSSAIYNAHPRVVQIFGFFGVSATKPEAGLYAVEALRVEHPFEM